MMNAKHRARTATSPTLEPLEIRLLLDAVKVPYLQAVMPDSIYVLVEADSQADATVDYGPTASYGMQAATESTENTEGSYYVHNVKLTGLQPNTQYHYRVKHGATTSADKTFWTAADPGTGFRFGFMADCRTGTDVHAQVASAVDTFGTRMLLIGGDTNGVATWDSWNTEFFLPEQEALNAEVPFANATGNHEGWNALTRAYTQGPDGDGSGFFSFDYGDAHFLILNTEVSYSQGSAQWDFAASDLSASTAPWKIVASHKPAYSSYRVDAGMQAMTSAIFEPNGVDMVLAGHDHFYEHNLVNGIRHMIIGSSGAPLYAPGSPESYTVYSEQTYCFGIFDVTATTLDLATYREDGTPIETISLVRDTTPPTAPTNLSATGATDTRIDLAWTAASDGESGISHYRIYRNDQFVGTIAQTSYSDTGLSAQTSYTYEVSAVNGSMLEGPKSAPAVGTTLPETTPETLIPTGSTWKYLDNGTDQGTAWREPGFDDGTWSSGPAQLGYGDGDEATVVGYGLDAGNKYITTYFRHTFELSQASQHVELALDLLRDDGAVVYLNGQEAARSNMPGGVVSFDTFSSAIVGGADESTFYPFAPDADLLVEGTNVLAVEIHQCNLTSSDLSFDLELVGTRLPGPDTTPPTTALAVPQDNGPDDLDPADGAVTVNTTQSSFQVQLSDVGDGVDDTTVTGSTVALSKDSAPLSESADYAFSYDGAADRITLAPIGGDFDNGDYEIALNGGAAKIADLAGNEMAAATLTVEIDTSIVTPVTLTFQQGAGGYGAMVDTMIRWADADTNFAAYFQTGYPYQYNADTDSSGGPSQVLLRFGEIVGPGPGQIAPGSQVQSATLRLRSTDDGNGGNLHPVLAAWVDTDVTWNNSFGGDGVQADDAEAALAADDGVTQNLPDTDVDLDVTATVQAWASGEASNNGWAVLPNGTNGWHMAAAEHPTLDYRPELIVTFYAGPDATPPTAGLLVPLDNGPDDFDPTDGAVTVNTTQADCQIQLDDAGDGVDDATVTSETVAVSQDSTPLVEGTDYSFGYDAVGDVITLIPIGGDFGDGVYEIVLSDGAAKIADVAGNAMGATTLTVVVDTSIVVPQSLSFQQGVGAYAGTVDTNLLESAPNADYATAASFTIDTDEPPGSGGAAQGLMRFEDVFGSGPGQIPPGAQIVSAELQLQVFDGGNSFNLHRMLQTWADTDTWNTLGSGIQADGSEAASTADASTGAVGAGTLPIDVTAGLTMWAADPSTNYGWAMLPTGTDGVDLYSAEGTTPPALSVTFLPPGPNDPPVALDDTASTDEDTPVTIAVLANDSDPNGDPLSVDSVTQGSNGSVAINGDNTVTYTPDADFHGPDSFTYTNSDGRGGTATAAVTVTVNPINDAPVAQDSPFSVDEDDTLDMPAPGVLANDTDVEGDALTAVLVGDVANGALTLNGDGSFTYTPDGDFNGTDSFTYMANDSQVDSNVATVTITVNPMNDAPAAGNDAATTSEDTPVSVDVLANDTDIDGDALTVESVTQPANGSAANNGTDVSYTPDADFNGVDTFTYVVSDGHGGTGTATVTVTVQPVNDAPVATDDAASTDEDAPVITPDVLANDTDVDGDTLSVSSFTQPANGSAAYNGDGTFTYTPAADFNGDGTFTYTVSDGNGGEDTAAVTVTVAAVNDAPVAQDDSFSVGEDGSDSGAVVATDVDAGDTLTYSIVSGPANGQLAGFDANTGAFTYEPAADYNGPDSFTFQANDQQVDSNVATVSITVDPVNDAPVAQDDSFSVGEDGSYSAAVAATDVDAGDTLTYSIVSGPANGQLTSLDTNTGAFTYEPAADYNGPDSFTFQANDGAADSNVATVSIAVDPVNDAPVAGADAYEVDQDGTLVVAAPGVLANDSDAESDPLTAVLVTGAANGSLTLNSDGSFTYTPNAGYAGPDSFTYVANDGIADGNVATVAITVRAADAVVGSNVRFLAKLLLIDLTNTSPNTPTTMQRLELDWPSENRKLRKIKVDQAIVYDTKTDPPSALIEQWKDGSLADRTIGPGETVALALEFERNANTDESLYALRIDFGDGLTVFIPPPETAPVAADDAYSVDEDGVLSVAAAGGVLANDSDPQSDPLTAALVGDVSHGALTLSADGSFTYTPASDFSGTDSFTYQANDGQADSNEATVTLTVNAVNDPPEASDDSAITSEDTPVSMDVLANDNDVDGHALAVTGVTEPAHGSAAIEPDDTVTYTPDGGFTGADTFDYTVSDGNGGFDTGTVTVTVNAANDPPVAAGDEYSVDEDTTLTVAAPGVLANDTDAEGDALTALLVSGPSHGELTLNADGSFLYTPDADFHGTDSFTYKANDGMSDSDVAAVTITVDPVNDAPVASDDAYGVDKDSTLTVDAAAGVLANDSDVDGDSLTAGLVGGPSNGTLTLNADGSFEYTPNAGYTGSDSFTYTAHDGTAASTVATVTITVTGSEVVGSNVRFDGNALLIDLTNTSLDTAVTIQQLQLDWPPENKKLRKIRVDGEAVYDTKTDPPSALIDQWKDGSVASRTIEPGQTVTLTFEFDGTANTDPSAYGLSIDFGSGMTVFL